MSDAPKRVKDQVVGRWNSLSWTKRAVALGSITTALVVGVKGISALDAHWDENGKIDLVAADVRIVASDVKANSKAIQSTSRQVIRDGLKRDRRELKKERRGAQCHRQKPPNLDKCQELEDQLEDIDFDLAILE